MDTQEKYLENFKYNQSGGNIVWTPRENNRQWKSIASSADGNKLVAVVIGGYIYTGNFIPTSGPLKVLSNTKVPVEPPLLSISIMPSLVNNQQIGGYKEKYLKYKQKYLQLKNNIK